MKSDYLQQISWFDLVALGMIIVGLVRGRKHGMSEELLIVLQWLLIVVLGAMLYRPVGDFILLTVHISPAWMYVGVYLTLAVLVKVFFTLVKRSVGEKLIGSDVFGRLEYYLGMVAGAGRFCCILLLVMAVLNAKYVSQADLQREAKSQEEAFGDISFPTFDSLQYEVFHHSLTGQLVKKYLHEQLIASTGPAAPRQEGVIRKREREVNEMINGR